MYVYTCIHYIYLHPACFYNSRFMMCSCSIFPPELKNAQNA